MTKLCIIGAGSVVFTKTIVTDIFLMDEFKNIQISLMDINEKRLKISENIVKSIAKKLNINPQIEIFTERKPALKNADFVQTTFQVGGYEPSTVIDFRIPQKYGLQQTIGDSLGIGGIMRGLRTIPVLFEIAEDIREVCPNAILLQYVNPMCINMIALNKVYPDIQSIGLCHSVQGTAEMLAEDLNENINDIKYECAGINHMAFYTKFEKKLSDGSFKDLYPALKDFGNKIISNNAVSSRSKKISDYSQKILHEKVRYEILNRFGYFVTESSEHFSEYVSWFIKNNKPNLLEEFKIPLNEYIDRCIINNKLWKNYDSDPASVMDLEIKKSHEYASNIMKAKLTDETFTLNGNVFNKGLIENLPEDCVVEVPCKINKQGINPEKIGKLPIQLAALMMTNINVQLLASEAAITKKKDFIYQAALLDPHTSSELSINEIYNMVDELLEAHKEYLPEYN